VRLQAEARVLWPRDEAFAEAVDRARCMFPRKNSNVIVGTGHAGRTRLLIDERHAYMLSHCSQPQGRFRPEPPGGLEHLTPGPMSAHRGPPSRDYGSGAGRSRSTGA
jgi:hypothetical protein